MNALLLSQETFPTQLLSLCSLPSPREGGSDSERSSIALPCMFQGQAPHPGELSRVITGLALLQARVGNEVRRLEALKPEVLANQPWGFSISSSPTRCMWMQVSSLIPDSSVYGKHVSSASFLGSRGEANTYRHTHTSRHSHRLRGCMRRLKQLSLLHCVHPSQTQVVSYARGL